MLQDHFRQALIDCDVNLVRKLWVHVAPHFPQPGDDDDVLKTIHYARTASETIPFKHRAYSHSWLMERTIPSGLPDKLRPKAERMYPVAVGAVGISVRSGVPSLAREVRSAMEYVVMDCYANGDEDPKIIKPLMMAARDKVKKRF